MLRFFVRGAVVAAVLSVSFPVFAEGNLNSAASTTGVKQETSGTSTTGNHVLKKKTAKDASAPSKEMAPQTMPPQTMPPQTKPPATSALGAH